MAGKGSKAVLKKLRAFEATLGNQVIGWDARTSLRPEARVAVA